MKILPERKTGKIDFYRCRNISLGDKKKEIAYIEELKVLKLN